MIWRSLPVLLMLVVFGVLPLNRAASALPLHLSPAAPVMRATRFPTATPVPTETPGPQPTLPLLPPTRTPRPSPIVTVVLLSLLPTWTPRPSPTQILSGAAGQGES